MPRSNTAIRIREREIQPIQGFGGALYGTELPRTVYIFPRFLGDSLHLGENSTISAEFRPGILPDVILLLTMSKNLAELVIREVGQIQYLASAT